MTTQKEMSDKNSHKPHWATYNLNKLTVRLDPKLLLRFGHYKSENYYNTTEALNKILDKHLPHYENNA